MFRGSAPQRALLVATLSREGLVGMQVLYERCAGVDIGKDVIAVAVRLPGDGPDGRKTIKRMFETFYGVLRECARWLTDHGVTHVAMEVTGIYSMPVYHALLAHGEFEQVLVCNAGHVKNVPGRKTDLSDAEWLAHLLECGLLRGSFIPSAEIKAARDVIRYRAKLTESRTSELSRLGNVLQDAGIKADSVASSITTKSVRAMVEALIDGERRPTVLAELARGRMRSKIPDLQRALEGRFDDHHALMCRLHLEHLDHLDAMIAKLDSQVEQMMRPFQPQRDLIVSIPGFGVRASAAIVSEIGADPARLVPVCRAAGLLGRAVPRQPRIGRQTTSRLGAARATSICSRSWSSARGPRCAPTASCASSTAARSASSAGSAAPPPSRRRSSRSRTS